MAAQYPVDNQRFPHKVRVHNTGDQTILAPCVQVTLRPLKVVEAELNAADYSLALELIQEPYIERSDMFLFNNIPSSRTIKMALWPEERGEFELDAFLPIDFYEFEVFFRDGAGLLWSRNPKKGSLKLVARPGKKKSRRLA